MLSRLALSLSPSGGCLSPSTVRGLYTACTRRESRAARWAAPLATTFRHSFVCTCVQRRRRMPLLFGTCVPGKGTACFFPPCSLMLRQHICAEPCWRKEGPYLTTDSSDSCSWPLNPLESESLNHVCHVAAFQIQNSRLPLLRKSVILACS